MWETTRLIALNPVADHLWCFRGDEGAEHARRGPGRYYQPTNTEKGNLGFLRRTE